MDPSNMRPQAKPAAPKTSIRPQARPQVYDTPAQAIQAAEENLAAQPGQVKKQFEKGEDYTIHPVQGGFVYKLAPTVNIGASPSGGTRGIGGAAYESQIDAAFDKLLGQFADNFSMQVEKLDPVGDEDDDIDNDGDSDDSDDYLKARRAAIAAAMSGNAKADAEAGERKKHMKKTDGNPFKEEDSKTPLGEFILSYYDRQQGVFPKGETAVLTMVEKSYGDRYIKPASQFIERLGQVYEKYQARKNGTFDLEEGVWDAVKGAVSGGIQGAKRGYTTSNFESKATELAKRYQERAPLVINNPNGDAQGVSYAQTNVEALLDIYTEIARLGHDIKNAGGGTKTTQNAIGMKQNLFKVQQGDQNAMNRLRNQVGNEAKFIMDFVKQDIQSIQGESVDLNRIQELAGLK
jgi:hypothetical protein